jgi:hypothetical protein
MSTAVTGGFLTRTTDTESLPTSPRLPLRPDGARAVRAPGPGEPRTCRDGNGVDPVYRGGQRVLTHRSPAQCQRGWPERSDGLYAVVAARLVRNIENENEHKMILLLWAELDCAGQNWVVWAYPRLIP